ncbi:16S rRNA m(7)G-527 methyltransferase [Faunimonas pinastri]|uniref:Ribosomal RNA small subunit methyltransferase G n=1 Tax=Faunimonas pinastri TaxID=1855383 RepID=A0A1H9GW10_9HYPH|nr:16S rRNA (guanine(527)-N(7))-methyltransferase RsmG [Faunimonas pinastri]SEQ54200.1 16S rRNA m(7)G-527 methyltransferase [Faunimonas pinastri]
MPVDILPGDARNVLSRFEIEPAAGERLSVYVELLRKWQATHNLVSHSTLPEVWTRHVADSLQLVSDLPERGLWMDVGSGGGFPGLVLAVVAADKPDLRFVLVESNGKKCAFLRTVARETGARAEIVLGRIEDQAERFGGRADVVSARALAPLDDLCRLTKPLLTPKGALLAMKGQDFAAEEAEAARNWTYDLATRPSLIDPAGCVATLRHLQARTSPS